jgi:hypothetical protein
MTYVTRSKSRRIGRIRQVRWWPCDFGRIRGTPPPHIVMSMEKPDSQSGPLRPREDQHIREVRKNGELPCGARYCHRCHEECGVIVNAYILQDLVAESHDCDS